MFDMSWGEIMVIGGVALIVIGPKDLPKALRTVGQMTTKVRRMASEFQSQFNEAMREAELEDVRKEVEGLNRDVRNATSSGFNPIQTIRDEIRGAVDAKPSTYPAAAASSGVAASGVEEVGPDHHLVASDPATSSASETHLSSEPARIEGLNPDAELRPEVALNPDVHPLVPLPIDEPPLPASTEPPMLVTGPGLEPLTEGEGSAPPPRRREDAVPKSASA